MKKKRVKNRKKVRSVTMKTYNGCRYCRGPLPPGSPEFCSRPCEDDFHWETERKEEAKDRLRRDPRIAHISHECVEWEYGSYTGAIDLDLTERLTGGRSVGVDQREIEL